MEQVVRIFRVMLFLGINVIEVYCTVGFAKKLQSLARKGDSELMAAFEASYEGSSYNQETFDEAFFLDNARDIVKEDDEELEQQKLQQKQR